MPIPSILRHLTDGDRRAGLKATAPVPTRPRTRRNALFASLSAFQAAEDAAQDRPGHRRGDCAADLLHDGLGHGLTLIARRTPTGRRAATRCRLRFLHLLGVVATIAAKAEIGKLETGPRPARRRRVLLFLFTLVFSYFNMRLLERGGASWSY